MSLWDQIKKIFNEAEESSVQKPILTGQIERTDDEEAAYVRWKLTSPCEQFLQWIRKQYGQYQLQENSQSRGIDFLNTPSSKGFAIYLDTSKFKSIELQYLFDFLKEQVQTLGYRNYSSDYKTYHKNGAIETLFRHYLKPPLHRGGREEKVNQLYGNILIELFKRKEGFVSLRFRCNSYFDYKYEPAKDFDELLAKIIKL